MNLLLDTHVLLWWLDDNPALSKRARDRIADGTNEVYISAATVWEIIIKRSLRKLIIPDDFAKKLRGFGQLDITTEHVMAVRELPDYHRDPFDRILIAQCIVNGLVLVTGDKNIKRYVVPVLDA